MGWNRRLVVEIDFKFPAWAEMIKAREQELNLFIAANIQFNRGMLFDNEGAYNGRPRWADLVFRNGQILSKRGVLRKSIAPFNPRGTPGPDGIVRFSGDIITVGTKLMYARLMNDGTVNMPGGVMRPVKAKALKIPVPEGDKAGEAAQEIQARHWEAKNKQLRKEIGNYKRGSRKQQDILKRITKNAEKMFSGKGPVKFIFRKSVRIPARPFDDWNEQDQAELNAAIMSKLISMMNGK